MSHLENRDWAQANIAQRIVAKTIVPCQLGEVREEEPRDTKSGSAFAVAIPLTLEEARKTVDNEDIGAGFPVTTRIRWFLGNGSDLPDNLKKANEMSDARFKQLVVAAFGLRRDTKENVGELLKNNGGLAGLNGKRVLVSFDVRDGNDGVKYQDCTGFNAVKSA